MKKQIILSGLFIFCASFGFGQTPSWQYNSSNYIYNSSGNVGIGTTSAPAEKLHVIGGIRSYKNGDNAINPQLYLGNTNNDRAFSFQLNSNGSSLNLWTYAPYSWNNRFTFTTGGSLGIGTTDPQAYLHVKTPTSSGSGLIIDHLYAGAYNFGALVNVNHDQTKALVVQRMSGPNSGTEVFKVWGNGTVNMKNVYAEAITVTPTSLSSWPDYVFKKEYKLMPLKELEEYINKNNHLPNVPSSEEISKNGVNVYEMNKTLLEKVEEMSLYIIELKKEIDEIKQKIK